MHAYAASGAAVSVERGGNNATLSTFLALVIYEDGQLPAVVHEPMSSSVFCSFSSSFFLSDRPSPPLFFFFDSVSDNTCFDGYFIRVRALLDLLENMQPSLRLMAGTEIRRKKREKVIWSGLWHRAANCCERGPDTT